MRTLRGILAATFVLATLSTAAFGGVVLHLDAASIAQANGTPVSAWGILSQGNANKQPVYTTSAINSLPAVTFDGVGDHALGDALLGSSVNINARTIYAVVNATAGGGLRGMLSNANDGLSLRLRNNTSYNGPANGQNSGDFTGNGGTGTFRIDGDVQTPLGPGTLTVGTPHIVAAVSAANHIYGNFLVGSPRTSGGPWTTRYWQGDIAEIIIYDNVLNKTDHQAQLDALGTKYGITVSQRTQPGFEIGSLLGGDLTDPENDGLPDSNVNYNATFSSTNEPGFASQGAYNVFDNRTGGGNDKWCCDDPGVTGLQLDATFVNQYLLTSFTLTSSNDSPGRDPSIFSIEGSNDGVTFDTIFSYDGSQGPLWSARRQTLLFEAGIDFDYPTFYRTFRYNVADTVSGGHALGEIEYFGERLPEPGTLSLLALGGIGLLRRRRRRRV